MELRYDLFNFNKFNILVTKVLSKIKDESEGLFIFISNLCDEKNIYAGSHLHFSSATSAANKNFVAWKQLHQREQSS